LGGFVQTGQLLKPEQFLQTGQLAIAEINA